jgi:sugar-specific transcriptional regulator TrmB
MSNIQGLMRHNKRELCEIILKYEIACDDIQSAVKELLKENENLKVEAEADSKSYDELLQHKKSIMKKYRDELHKAKKNTLVELEIANIADIGGNVISLQ